MQKLHYETARKRLKLIGNLKDIDLVKPSVLLLRHGDRNKIPSGEFGNEVELNEKGILNSMEFGNSISHLPVRGIYTSPIKRCIQTAEMIIRGLGKDVPLTVTDLLGDPGPFVYPNDKAAGESFLRLGGFGLMDKLIHGERVPGFRTIEEGTSILNRLFLDNSREAGTNIYVSHDLIIALYSWGMFRKLYTPDNWIQYLDGALIQLNNAENEK